ncbi:MAG: TonB-dependent receptor [Bacteroidales bacterium]|nr:TonB-dependent receptor [Bacteroidales bacterium]
MTHKLRILIQLLTFSVFFLAVQGLSAQTGAIRGSIYEKATGEPVIFCNVYLEGTTIGAGSDVNGLYMITRIPPGTYTLMVTNLGYDTIKMEVEIEADKIINQNLFLTSASVTLDEVNISAYREEARTETQTSVNKVTPKEITKIPSVGGQPDLAQYLQVLPGVVFTGDQGGQLYIRGGSPIQNKVLLDGMIVYNPFHSIGLFSVFDTDILRNADVYTGGFGAEYGGRISSVMDITTRDGNKKRFAGKVDASTFGAKVLIEGPLAKQKEDGGASSSFIFSAKNSYLEQSSKIFYDYVDEDGLPFNYLDLYGKLSFHFGNGSKINFYGFNFTDDVNKYKSIADFSWKSAGVGANFMIIPAKTAVMIAGHAAYSNYRISLKDEINPERSSEINGFNMGFDFNYFLGRDQLKYGIEVLGFTTDYFFINSVGRTIQQKENTTELGLFLKYKKTAGKFLIEPSMRLQWYASLSTVSPEPRLSLKYNATDKFRIKFAGGLYSQNLISATSDRDVVNLFYGFLSGPDNLPDEFNDKEVTHNLQKSSHLILGTELDIGKFITVNLEGYYKYFSQLTNLNRNKIFDEGKAPNEPQLLTKDFIIETGDAEGIDMTFKFDNNHFYIWAVYSLSWVNRNYEDIQGELQHYYPHFDRRHNVNLLGVYRFGGKMDWEVSARWNFGTGFPFTQTQGYYELINFDEGIYTDYTTANGELGVLYADLNAGRLPTYHRLDLNIKKRFSFSENTIFEIDASVVNVYNRENIFYVDRITNEIVYQLPVMPSLGVSLAF